MAEVRGNAYNAVAPYFIYNTVTNNNTVYELDITAGVVAAAVMDIGGGYRIKYAITGASAIFSGRIKWTETHVGRSPLMGNGHTINKAHSAQNVTVTVTLQTAPASSTSYTNRTTATKTFSIPAKTSYSVTYNANGGSGAPSTQTKWYGESLTLATTKPSKSGYTFKGWATSKDNANAGIATYQPGNTYPAVSNAALTLYAVWELDHVKPTISELKVDRYDNTEGRLDDEGTYACVTFNWSIFESSLTRYYGGSGTPPYENNEGTCVVTVSNTDTQYSESTTVSLSGSSGSGETVIVGSDQTGLDPDTQYTVSVSITDSPTDVSAVTTEVTTKLSSAKFPIDINSDGTAVGLLRTAPDDDTGLFVGGKITSSGNISDGSGTYVPHFIGSVNLLSTAAIYSSSSYSKTLTLTESYKHFAFIRLRLYNSSYSAEKLYSVDEWGSMVNNNYVTSADLFRWSNTNYYVSHKTISDTSCTVSFSAAPASGVSIYVQIYGYGRTRPNNA